MSQETSKIYEVDINATPEQVWQSLTDPKLTQQYYFNTQVDSDWQAGSKIYYRDPTGGIILEGEIVKFDPPRQLTTTFKPAWAPQAQDTDASVVSWEISSQATGCKLKLTHQGLDPNSPVSADIQNAWMPTLSSLKGVVESSIA